MSDNIGKRIRRLRKAKPNAKGIQGMSVRELARVCHMQPSAISNIELGRTKSLATYNLRRIAKGLGVSVDDLVIGRDKAKEGVA